MQVHIETLRLHPWSDIANVRGRPISKTPVIWGLLVSGAANISFSSFFLHESNFLFVREDPDERLLLHAGLSPGTSCMGGEWEKFTTPPSKMQMPLPISCRVVLNHYSVRQRHAVLLVRLLIRTSFSSLRRGIRRFMCLWNGRCFGLRGGPADSFGEPVCGGIEIMAVPVPVSRLELDWGEEALT